MSDETISALLGKMDEISHQLGVIDTRLSHFTEELARHQEGISTLAENVTSIKLERAKERGYFLGALAVGTLAGGMIGRLLGL
jgi:chromosome segregation ATPase